MKKLLFSISFLTLLFSCKNDNKASNNDETKTDNVTENVVEKTPEEKLPEGSQLYTENNGLWVGDFEAKEFQEDKEFVYVNKITIDIKGIYKEEVIGESIVAGNIRPMNGTYTKQDNVINFDLNEPGDDKYDGVFKFKIENDTLSGIWYANDKKSVVTERQFKLVKRDFKYNPRNMIPKDQELVDWFTRKMGKSVDGEQYDEEIYRAASEKVTIFNSSTTKFNEKMLKNLKKIDLEILRNTIYARHGLTFKKKTFRQFFDPVSWYIPISKDVSAELTPLENENIALLKRYEKYATDNYDYFGR